MECVLEADGAVPDLAGFWTLAKTIIVNIVFPNKLCLNSDHTNKHPDSHRISSKKFHYKSSLNRTSSLTYL